MMRQISIYIDKRFIFCYTDMQVKKTQQARFYSVCDILRISLMEKDGYTGSTISLKHQLFTIYAGKKDLNEKYRKYSGQNHI